MKGMSLTPVSPYQTGTVDLSAMSASYDIVIGDGVLNEVGALILSRLGQRRCIIITDANVAPRYGKRCEASVTAAGHTLLPTYAIKPGEGSKSFIVLQSVLDHLLKSGVDRKTIVIAMGGGVVGDLAGLAAALTLRGLDIVQVPTSLLAQVDSAVGGKTGIDTNFGKNTVGAFHQPRLVVADVSALDTLPAREMRAGYAEIVKYGLIMDADFFRWCQLNAKALLAGDRAAQIHAIGKSCAYKAKVIAADEREAGQRALLNLGHTFGHALEAAAGFGDTLLHGEAVAIGMALAFQLSAKLGLCPASDAEAVSKHLAAAGLPVTSPAILTDDINRLMAFMAQDKKAEAGKLTLVLANGIGKAFITRDVKSADVRQVWCTQ